MRVLLIAALVLGGCAQVQEVSTNSRIPEAYLATDLQQCLGPSPDAEKRRQCQCGVDEMRRTMTVSEYRALVTAHQAGEKTALATRAGDIARMCKARA